MLKFPPVELADEDGLLCVGGNLNSETLYSAYHQGIFPWPFSERAPLVWFAPPRRGVLFLEEAHIPKSVQKMLRNTKYQCRIDTNFDQVIRCCAATRGDTWITPAMISAYNQLHAQGIAHSVEAYLDGELAGGLYGVSWGKYFCGESMFHLRSGASKAALVHLLRHLQERGARWLDIQNISPLFELFGAREIPREQFMELLQDAIQAPGSLFGEE